MLVSFLVFCLLNNYTMLLLKDLLISVSVIKKAEGGHGK